MLNCIFVFAQNPASQVWNSGLVSRSFLLSLWLKDLARFAVPICLALLAAARIVHLEASKHSTVDSNPINITKRLKELTEEI
jgi:hypothetical protein